MRSLKGLAEQPYFVPWMNDAAERETMALEIIERHLRGLVSVSHELSYWYWEHGMNSCRDGWIMVYHHWRQNCNEVGCTKQILYNEHRQKLYVAKYVAQTSAYCESLPEFPTVTNFPAIMQLTARVPNILELPCKLNLCHYFFQFYFYLF